MQLFVSWGASGPRGHLQTLIIPEGAQVVRLGQQRRPQLVRLLAELETSAESPSCSLRGASLPLSPRVMLYNSTKWL